MYNQRYSRAPVLMMRVLAMAALALIGCENSQDEMSLVNWYEDYEAALEAASEKAVPVFADFYSPRCGPCIDMNRDVFSTQAVADVLNDEFIPLKINAADNGPLASRYRVSFVPTLVVMNNKGEVIDQVTGFRDSDQLLDFLAGARAKWAD